MEKAKHNTDAFEFSDGDVQTMANIIKAAIGRSFGAKPLLGDVESGNWHAEGGSLDLLLIAEEIAIYAEERWQASEAHTRAEAEEVIGELIAAMESLDSMLVKYKTNAPPALRDPVCEQFDAAIAKAQSYLTGQGWQKRSER